MSDAEVFHLSAEDIDRERWCDDDGLMKPGWYWWPKQSQHVYDDEPRGPFPTETAATEAMQASLVQHP